MTSRHTARLTLLLFRRGARPYQRLPQLPEGLGASGGPLALPQRLQQVRQLGLGGAQSAGRQPSRVGWRRPVQREADRENRPTDGRRRGVRH